MRLALCAVLLMAACHRDEAPPPARGAKILAEGCVAARTMLATDWEHFGAALADVQRQSVTGGSDVAALLTEDAAQVAPAGAPPALAAAVQARATAAAAERAAEATQATAAQAATPAIAAAVTAWRGAADAMDAQHAALVAATAYADAAQAALTARERYLRGELAVHAAAIAAAPKRAPELRAIDPQLTALAERTADGAAALDGRLRAELRARAESAAQAVEICTARP